MTNGKLQSFLQNHEVHEGLENLDAKLLSGTSRPKAQAKGKIYKYHEINVFSFVFSWEGTVFRGTWIETILAVLVAVVLTIITMKIPEPSWMHLNLDGHKITIIPIGFLLVIRTNLAYGRYWEGRGLIGQLMFHARELSSKARTYIVDNNNTTNVTAASLRANVLRLTAAYLILVRHHLWRSKSGGLEELDELFTEKERMFLTSTTSNRPVIVITWLRDVLCSIAEAEQFVNPYAMRSLDRNVSGLLNSWMGMAKITSTPFPFPYAHMLRVFIYVWVLTLPWAMVGTLQWVTPAVTAFVAFSLFGINTVGEELEDPFGEDHNDFDLVAFENVLLEDMQNIRTAV